jgi:hypothetical protein
MQQFFWICFQKHLLNQLFLHNKMLISTIRWYFLVKLLICSRPRHGSRKFCKSSNSSGSSTFFNIIKHCFEMHAVSTTASCLLVRRAPGSLPLSGIVIFFVVISSEFCYDARQGFMTSSNNCRCLLHALDAYTSSVSHVYVIDPKSIKKEELYGTFSQARWSLI